MDGPTSRLPSTTATISDLDLIHQAATIKSSVKELFFSAPTTPRKNVDPPRPAKEGHEWVWFPAGYWAEREVVESPGREFIKNFRWRKRSGKDSSSRDKGEDYPELTKQHSKPTLPRLRSSHETSGPSLQRPPIIHHATSSESSSSVYPLNRSPHAPLPSPYLTEEMHVLSLQNPSAQGIPFGSISGKSSSRLRRTMSNSSYDPVEVASNRTTPRLDSISSRPEKYPGLVSPKRLTPLDSDEKHKKWFLNRLLQADSRSPKQRKPTVNSTKSMYSVTASKCSQEHLNPTRVLPVSRVNSILSEESKKPHRTWSINKFFGKSPWHRKSSEAGSEPSASSSVLSVLRGETPLPSPNFVNKRDYFRVPYNSCYPAGEAVRLKTPPLRETAGNNNPRSFFFDISNPRPCDHNDRPFSRPASAAASATSSRQSPFGSKTPTVTASGGSGDSRSTGRSNSPKKEVTGPGAGARRNTRVKKKQKGLPTEWWEVAVSMPRYKDMAPSAFEFDLPEHLPNSPMCPANRKHKSGGTGVCVYHGRRKPSPAVEGTRPKARAAAEGTEEESDKDDERLDVGDSELWK